MEIPLMLSAPEIGELRLETLLQNVVTQVMRKWQDEIKKRGEEWTLPNGKNSRASLLLDKAQTLHMDSSIANHQPSFSRLDTTAMIKLDTYPDTLALPFFGIGMKTDLFQSSGHCWVFQVCWHIECSTFTASSFRIWKSSTWIPSPPLALFVVS